MGSSNSGNAVLSAADSIVAFDLINELPKLLPSNFEASPSIAFRDALVLRLANTFRSAAILFGGITTESRLTIEQVTAAAIANSAGGRAVIVTDAIANWEIVNIASYSAATYLRTTVNPIDDDSSNSRVINTPQFLGVFSSKHERVSRLGGLVIHQQDGFSDHVRVMGTACLRLIARQPNVLFPFSESRNDQIDTCSLLAPRASEVLNLLRQGMSEKEVAAHIGLSRATVHGYVVQIYRIYQVNSRAELLAKFINGDRC